MAQGKGNPEINKKVATSALVTTILSGVGFYLGNRYWEAVASFGGQFFEHWGDGFALMWPLIAENPVHIDMSPNAMLAGLTMCVLVWLFWLRYVAFVGNFRAGEESGSARWGTLKEGKQFRDLTTEDNNLIFTQNFGLALHRPKFNPELDRNLNVLVVGGSGSGKTFNYVTPNICQLNTSYFITDPKGTLLKDAGFLFTDNGYKVKSFNTINLDESMHYNPLKYVKGSNHYARQRSQHAHSGRHVPRRRPRRLWTYQPRHDHQGRHAGRWRPTQWRNRHDCRRCHRRGCRHLFRPAQHRLGGRTLRKGRCLYVIRSGT